MVEDVTSVCQLTGPEQRLYFHRATELRYTSLLLRVQTELRRTLSLPYYTRYNTKDKSFRSSDSRPTLAVTLYCLLHWRLTTSQDAQV